MAKFDYALTRLQAFTLFAFSAFVSFSIAGAHISLGLLALFVILRIWRAKKPAANLEAHSASRYSTLRLGIERPLGVFFFVALISTALSDAPRDSFFHLKHLLIVCAAYAVAYSLRSQPVWRAPVLWIFLTTATLASLWGLLEFGLGFSPKVQSTQSTTMSWGALCAMFMLISLQSALALKVGRQRWHARLFFLTQCFALLLSFVRGAYVGFAAGAAYLLQRHWKRLITVAVVMLIVIGFLAPPAVRERIVSIFDLQNPTVLVRLTQWRIATRIIADHPIFGVGLHDLAALTQHYSRPDPRLPEAVNHDVFHIGHYHSTYFTLTVCFGLAGLFAFVWLMFSVWQNLGKTWSRVEGEDAGAIVWACRAAVISFCVSGFFDWTFGDAEVVTMFWFLVGMGLGQSRPLSEAPRPASLKTTPAP